MNRSTVLLDSDQAEGTSGPGTLDGERKFVTVMFADMAQSSRLVIGQDPEDADERLLAVLQLMIDAVHRFGGTVNQVLGPGCIVPPDCLDRRPSETTAPLPCSPA